ncbi:MAG: ABC-type amino acid transport substrate-binding protein [Verrucomicrobiales bacterium]|jgi:ABC-type amino acid transport substrate-binding protein
MMFRRQQSLSACRTLCCVRSLIMAFLALLLPTVAGAETPIIGSGSFDFPPYQYLDANGQPAGLDVDLFNAAAIAAGMKPEIRVASRDQQETGVRLGTSYTTLTANETSTLPYTKTSHALYANKRSLVRGIEDLRAKQIVVLKGNDALRNYLFRHGYGNQLTLAESPEQALQLIAEDAAEVTILDTVSAAQTLERLPDLESTVRLVDIGIAPCERTFSIAASSAGLCEKIEAGIRTTIRTGQYDRMLVSHLGAAANTSRVTFASASSITSTIPIFIAVILSLFGLVMALRLNDFKGRAMAKLRALEEQNANEIHAQQELRLALARQQFVINRISTTNLVDVIKEASRN